MFAEYRNIVGIRNPPFRQVMDYFSLVEGQKDADYIASTLLEMRRRIHNHLNDQTQLALDMAPHSEQTGPRSRPYKLRGDPTNVKPAKPPTECEISADKNDEKDYADDDPKETFTHYHFLESRAIDSIVHKKC